MSMISFDNPTPPAVRPPSRWRSLGVVLSVVVIAAAIVAIAVWRKPHPPAAPAPATHALELRIYGDGVGQLARIWDARGSREIDSWAGPWELSDLRGVLFVAQAGLAGPVDCAILLDGIEVERATAEALSLATCAWVR